MKLKLLREHYQSVDNGETWIPKVSFESPDEITAAGFNPNRWHTYKCNFCERYHVASKEKIESRNNDK